MNSGPRQAEIRLATEVFDRIRLKQHRSIGQFAEEELTVMSGPHVGMKFRLDRHPVAKLLFDEIESGRWQRIFVLGPNQDGKTFMAFLVVVLYWVLELGARVVVAAPNDTIVKDKWQLDLLKIIKESRYASALPETGASTRGGTPEMIEFANGGVIRFMTAGGDDQSRSHFTAQFIGVTESEGFDEVGANSREGKKFGQLEKRRKAYGADGRTVAECTVGTEEGLTWSEYINGSRSRIVIPCPHCGEYVTPGRDNFIGWQDAADPFEAAAKAFIHCPECGAAWTNEERLAANRLGKLAHGEQKVLKDGTVVGDPPATDTLGFRWTCVNSAINPDRMREVAIAEWKARRAEDREVAERDLCQIEWALPAKIIGDISGLDAGKIVAKTMPGVGRGIVPNDTVLLTLGADVGKHLIHWTLVAWRSNGSMHVVDYDIEEVPTGTMQEEVSIPIALKMLKDRVDAVGWKRKDGKDVRPSICFVDAGYMQNVVVGWTQSVGAPWYASKGFGATQIRTPGKTRETGSKVVSDPDEVDHYAVIRLPNDDEYVEVNSDYWKSWVHRRLVAPLHVEGGFTIYDGGNHLKFGKHVTAERETLEFVSGIGHVRAWKIINRNNHFGDAIVYAAVAAHAGGFRFEPIELKPERREEPREDLQTAHMSRPVHRRGGWMTRHQGTY